MEAEYTVFGKKGFKLQIGGGNVEQKEVLNIAGKPERRGINRREM